MRVSPERTTPPIVENAIFKTSPETGANITERSKTSWAEFKRSSAAKSSALVARRLAAFSLAVRACVRGAQVVGRTYLE